MILCKTEAISNKTIFQLPDRVKEFLYLKDFNEGTKILDIFKIVIISSD